MSNARVPATAEGMPGFKQDETLLGINYLRRGHIVATTIGALHGGEENPEHVATFFAPGVNPKALREVSMIDLRSMRDALHVTLEVVSALSCQPRFASENPHSYNGAGEALDELTQLLADGLEAVVDEAKRREPEASVEVEAKATLIAAHHVDVGGGFSSLAQHATSAAADIERAKSLEAAQ